MALTEDDHKQLMELLTLWRQNASQLDYQNGMQGGSGATTLSVANTRREADEKIRAIIRTLRDNGIKVERHPSDPPGDDVWAASAPITSGSDILLMALRDSRITSAAGIYAAERDRVREPIKRITALKSLHDAIQVAETSWLVVMSDIEKGQHDVTNEQWLNLVDNLYIVTTYMERARDVDAIQETVYNAWRTKFIRLYANFSAFTQDCDIIILRDTLDKIYNQCGGMLSIVNEKVKTRLNDLGLEKLAGALLELSSIFEQQIAPEYRGNIAERLSEEGIRIKKLEQGLLTLVERHDYFQLLSDELRKILNAEQRSLYGAIKEIWEDIQPLMLHCCASGFDWSDRLYNATNRFTQCVEQLDDAAVLQRSLKTYNNALNKHFNYVDADLKEKCAELQTIDNWSEIVQRRERYA